MSRTYRTASGVTLVDALLAMGVVAIALALLLPMLQNARERARRNACATNLQQVGEALLAYHAAHEAFPPGGTMEHELSWHVMVLPMLGRTELFEAFDRGNGPYHSTTVNHKNNPYGLVQIPQYLCPSAVQNLSVSFADAVGDTHTHTVHYYGIMGPSGANPNGGSYRMSSLGPFAEQGLLGYESKKRLVDITDGASTTFIVGELSWTDANVYRTWVRGVNGDAMSGAKNVRWPINEMFYRNNPVDDGNAGGFNDVSLGSDHPGGTHVLMGDGSVRFVSETIDAAVYRSTASINGGESEILQE